MIEMQQAKTRDIPVWLTVLVLLLCIGGGAWMIKWYIQDKPKDDIVIKDDKPTRGNMRNFSGTPAIDRGDRGDRTARWNPNTNGDGVSRNSRDSFVVRAGTAQMYVYQDRKGAITFNPSYGTMSLYTPDEREFALFVQQVRSDRTWRETLGVTDEQQQKLRNVPPAPGMRWEKTDEAKMTELWKAYEKANDKTAAERALVSALSEVAKRCLEPTKKYHQERMTLLKSIITAEQYKAYKDAGTKPAKLDPAKPEPAAKPAALNTTPPPAGAVTTAKLADPQPVIPAATKPAPATTTVTPRPANP